MRLGNSTAIVTMFHVPSRSPILCSGGKCCMSSTRHGQPRTESSSRPSIPVCDTQSRPSCTASVSPSRSREKSGKPCCVEDGRPPSRTKAVADHVLSRCLEYLPSGPLPSMGIWSSMSLSSTWRKPSPSRVNVCLPWYFPSVSSGVL
eukprot:scaffold98644_cov28-Tisochrysis_lutea.AAC.7